MTSFGEWTKGQNVEDDSHPDHFDHAALISRYEYIFFEFNGLFLPSRNKPLDLVAGCGKEKVLGSI